jgi:hypothetical protein
MKKLTLIVVLVAMNVLQGCQLDVQGPSMTAKLLYKGENNNQEHLSRGSGMTGGNNYSAGGGASMMTTGSGGGIVSWGSNRKGK